jgi:putative transposase
LCVACSYGNNADRVGALNILERGLRLLACGEVGSVSCSNTAKQPDSVKQEPTEVTRQGAILV